MNTFDQSPVDLNGARVHCPAGPHTHSVAEVCALIGCESEDWLVDRVRNGTFPGRKIVRQLRFGDVDIKAIIEVCAVRPKSSDALSLPVPNSRRRKNLIEAV